MGRTKRPANDTQEACVAYVRERLEQLMTLGKKKLPGKELHERLLLLRWYALLHNVPMPVELGSDFPEDVIPGGAALPPSEPDAPPPAAPQVHEFGSL